jgi:hypothetical protein
MTNKYAELKDSQEKEYNNFSKKNMFFAFSDNQFKE